MDDPIFALAPEKRSELAEMFAWPAEDSVSIAEERSDRRARAAASAVGFDVEKQMAAMMEARRRVAAQREAAAGAAASTEEGA